VVGQQVLRGSLEAAYLALPSPDCRYGPEAQRCADEHGYDVATITKWFDNRRQSDRARRRAINLRRADRPHTPTSATCSPDLTSPNKMLSSDIGLRINTLVEAQEHRYSVPPSAMVDSSISESRTGLPTPVECGPWQVLPSGGAPEATAVGLGLMTTGGCDEIASPSLEAAQELQGIRRVLSFPIDQTAAWRLTKPPKRKHESEQSTEAEIEGTVGSETRLPQASAQMLGLRPDDQPSSAAASADPRKRGRQADNDPPDSSERQPKKQHASDAAAASDSSSVDHVTSAGQTLKQTPKVRPPVIIWRSDFTVEELKRWHEHQAALKDWYPLQSAATATKTQQKPVKKSKSAQIRRQCRRSAHCQQTGATSAVHHPVQCTVHKMASPATRKRQNRERSAQAYAADLVGERLRKRAVKLQKLEKNVAEAEEGKKKEKAVKTATGNRTRLKGDATERGYLLTGDSKIEEAPGPEAATRRAAAAAVVAAAAAETAPPAETAPTVEEDEQEQQQQEQEEEADTEEESNPLAMALKKQQQQQRALEQLQQQQLQQQRRQLHQIQYLAQQTQESWLHLQLHQLQQQLQQQQQQQPFLEQQQEQQQMQLQQQQQMQPAGAIVSESRTGLPTPVECGPWQVLPSSGAPEATAAGLGLMTTGVCDEIASPSLEEPETSTEVYESEQSAEAEIEGTVGSENTEQMATGMDGLRPGKTSRFQGVRWRRNRWCTRNFGSFENEVDAAKAWDKARRAKYGTLAHIAYPRLLNFPTDAEEAFRRNNEDSTTLHKQLGLTGSLVKWTDAEDEKLIGLVERDGEGDWEAKAASLGTIRTAGACATRYSKHLRHGTHCEGAEKQQDYQVQEEATEEEGLTIVSQRRAAKAAGERSFNETSMADEAVSRARAAALASEALLKNSSKVSPISQRKAARAAGERGFNETSMANEALARARAAALKSGDIKSDCAAAGALSIAWTSAEDSKLLKLVKTHGEGDWCTKAALLGTNRSTKACAARYRNYLRVRPLSSQQHEQQRGKGLLQEWSNEEDMYLQQLAEKLQEDLHTRFGSSRSIQQIVERLHVGFATTTQYSPADDRMSQPATQSASPGPLSQPPVHVTPRQTATNVSEQHEKNGEAPLTERTATIVAERKRQGQHASCYFGVSWTGKIWTATLCHSGAVYKIGQYTDEEDAARAWDAAARKYRGANAHGGRNGRGQLMRLNFPTAEEDAAAKEAIASHDAKIAAAAAVCERTAKIVTERKRQGQSASLFCGISWTGKIWTATIFHSRVIHSIGQYTDEEEAARAWDAAARKYRGSSAHGGRNGRGQLMRLNFPTADEEAAAKDAIDRHTEQAAGEAAACDLIAKIVAERKRQGQRASSYFGVSVSVSPTGKLWVATICHSGVTHTIGQYTDEEEAARAWDAAARKYRGSSAHGGRNGRGQIMRLNFPTADEEESFLRNGHGAAAATVESEDTVAEATERKKGEFVVGNVVSVLFKQPPRRYKGRVMKVTGSGCRVSFEDGETCFVPSSCDMQLLECLTVQSSLCSICQNDVAEDEDDAVVYQLGCGHVFHGDCISRWFEKCNGNGVSCPNCKKNFAGLRHCTKCVASCVVTEDVLGRL
jgi:hypothetical protein